MSSSINKLQKDFNKKLSINVNNSSTNNTTLNNNNVNNLVSDDEDSNDDSDENSNDDSDEDSENDSENDSEILEDEEEDDEDEDEDEEEDLEEIGEEIKYEYNNEKMELIVKPCQSGKTFVVLEEIKTLFSIEETENAIHVLFTDNSILQTDQLKMRINQDEDFSEYIDRKGSKSIILSSKSITKNIYKLLFDVIEGGHRNIITCSNGIRVRQMNDFFNLMKNKMNKDIEMKRYNFYIWIDEADKTFTNNIRQSYLNIWSQMNIIKKITFITATPRKLLLRYDKLKIMEMEETFDQTKYHSLQECKITIEDFETNDTISYITSFLEKYQENIKEGQVWFIPGDNEIETHEYIRTLLLKYGFSVIMINGTEKSLTMVKQEENRKIIRKLLFKEIHRDEAEMSKICGSIYEKYNLSKHKVAITGCLCISRGITISSDKMMITHSIMPPHVSDRSNAYQLAGRLCGNIKNFQNYVIPSVYMTEKFMNTVISMEIRAMNLSKIAKMEKKEMISLNDYDNSNQIVRFKTDIYEFDNLDELYRFEKDNGIRKSIPHLNINDGYYHCSLGNKSDIQSYDNVLEKLKSWNPYSHFSFNNKMKNSKKEKKVGDKYARLYTGYKDMNDPSSYVFILYVGEIIKSLESSIQNPLFVIYPNDINNNVNNTNMTSIK